MRRHIKVKRLALGQWEGTTDISDEVFTHSSMCEVVWRAFHHIRTLQGIELTPPKNFTLEQLGGFIIEDQAGLGILVTIH